MGAKIDEDYDVVVAGAGPVGLTAAIACAQLGFRTCAIGKVDDRDMGRTVALLDPSLVFYERLGLDAEIAAASAPLAVMRIVDDTDSLFRRRPVEFRATEIGLAAFGRNVENRALSSILATRAAATPGLTLIEGMVQSYVFTTEKVRAELAAGAVSGRVLIAADGRNSPARAAAGIEAQTWTYPQTALTAIFSHARPHADASTEFHTRGGPCTLVPLPPTESDPHRSSLVWMMTPREARRRVLLARADFAREAGRQTHFILGDMRLASLVGALPISGLRARRLVGRRLALAGDAAHGFPPIGAQGLNLGLRDVACLADALVRAPDPGAPAALELYGRRRLADIALRSFGVDLVNRSLPIASLPVDFARGLALSLLDSVGPLRRAAMRIGLAPILGAPASMRPARRAGPPRARPMAEPPPLDARLRSRP